MKSKLFEPWMLGNVKVENRIVMAPMSTNRVDSRGRITRRLLRYLERRAVGGCGMIIVESATVNAVLGGTGRNLRLDHGRSLPRLRALTRRLNESGAKVVAQLWHAGPRARVAGRRPVSASAPVPGSPTARALTAHEVRSVIEQFTAAGHRAASAGVDAVELHAAHGYLLHHFIDRETNRRNDSYGRTIEGRFRIVSEIRSALGELHPELPVILRLSLRPDDEIRDIARILEEAAFDAVDVRTGFSSMARSGTGDPMPPGYTLLLARLLRPHLTMPILAGGRILTPGHAEQAVALAGVDAVVLGRPLLADPDWARRARNSEAIVPCLYDCAESCYSHFKSGERLRCVHYGRME